MEPEIFIRATENYAQRTIVIYWRTSGYRRVRKLQLQFCAARCTARRAHYLKYTARRQRARNNDKYIIRPCAKWRGLRIDRPAITTAGVINMQLRSSSKLPDSSSDSDPSFPRSFDGPLNRRYYGTRKATKKRITYKNTSVTISH